MDPRRSVAKSQRLKSEQLFFFCCSFWEVSNYFIFCCSFWDVSNYFIFCFSFWEVSNAVDLYFIALLKRPTLTLVFPSPICFFWIWIEISFLSGLKLRRQGIMLWSSLLCLFVILFGFLSVGFQNSERTICFLYIFSFRCNVCENCLRTERCGTCNTCVKQVCCLLS